MYKPVKVVEQSSEGDIVLVGQLLQQAAESGELFLRQGPPLLPNRIQVARQDVHRLLREEQRRVSVEDIPSGRVYNTHWWTGTDPCKGDEFVVERKGHEWFR